MDFDGDIRQRIGELRSQLGSACQIPIEFLSPIEELEILEEIAAEGRREEVKIAQNSGLVNLA